MSTPRHGSSAATALVAGITGAIFAGTIYGTDYTLRMWETTQAETPWALMGLGLWALAALTGACFGLAIRGGLVSAERLGRGAVTTAVAILLAATVGGAVAGLLPGLAAASSFGTFNEPDFDNRDAQMIVGYDTSALT